MDTQIGAEGGTPDGYNYPNGYTQAYLLSGSWNTGFNRLTFSMNCSKSWPLQSTLSSVGTYIRDHGQTDPSFQGQHYYHYMANAVKSGVWYYFTLNGHPQHKVAQSPVINWPNNPEEVFPSFGTPINYYDGLTRWYINPYFSRDLTGTFACEWGPIAFGLVTDEPDEDVSTIASSYDGSTYHVDFAGPKNVTETYTVRCATSSMHTNGFGIGSTCGSSPSTQGNAYTYVNWAYTTPHVPALYVALRPHPVVIGATGNGVSPIILSFAVDPIYASGDQVTVTGVGGNTAANGTFNVTPIARRFWSFGNSSLTSVVVSGGIGTATTNSVHNLKAGQVVMVYHANDSGQWGYAPLYAVGSVPSTTTFTFSTAEPNGIYNSSNTPGLQIWSQPALDLQGTTGNGSWTNGGSVVSMSSTTGFTEVLISSREKRPNPCDLNSDGVVNSADVTLAIQMSLGQTACTANLNGAGVCNVLTVQRVINAANGQDCDGGR